MSLAFEQNKNIVDSSLLTIVNKIPCTALIDKPNETELYVSEYVTNECIHEYPNQNN